jgi:hypothetical protein
MVNGQWSMVNGQWSINWSMVNTPELTHELTDVILFNGQWSMGNCQRSTVKQSMVNPLVDGQHTRAHSRNRRDLGQWSMVNGQWSTVNGQTVNIQDPSSRTTHLRSRL